MTVHFQRELDMIKKRILSLGTMVEDRFRKAAKAVEHLDTDIAEEIIASDYQIDQNEVEIEEECLKLIALHQPVATDLRFIIVVIKINNDLERIADQGVNIAQRIRTIAKGSQVKPFYDYSEMAEKTERMLKLSLDAFVNMDVPLAYRVRAMDDEVDDIKDTVYDLVKSSIKADPEHVGRYINYYLISRHLERIADHATNIAEEVIYMVEGEIVRHVR